VVFLYRNKVQKTANVVLYFCRGIFLGVKMKKQKWIILIVLVIILILARISSNAIVQNFTIIDTYCSKIITVEFNAKEKTQDYKPKHPE
jgi:flagellar basal body-associated protein FliL